MKNGFGVSKKVTALEIVFLFFLPHSCQMRTDTRRESAQWRSIRMYVTDVKHERNEVDGRISQEHQSHHTSLVTSDS
jgi:hypothetical protein